jgi:hypothetical protein
LVSGKYLTMSDVLVLAADKKIQGLANWLTVLGFEQKTRLGSGFDLRLNSTKIMGYGRHQLPVLPWNLILPSQWQLLGLWSPLGFPWVTL